jgi:hypothetical protein
MEPCIVNRLYTTISAHSSSLQDKKLACCAHTQDPFLRTVKITAPLSQPIYGGASVAPFSEDDLFKKLNNEFIFIGRINKIQEVDINYNIVISGMDIRRLGTRRPATQTV